MQYYFISSRAILTCLFYQLDLPLKLCLSSSLQTPRPSPHPGRPCFQFSDLG